MLESFQVRSRLNRGRSYARPGQVLHLEITNHKVTGMVQGSIPIPYNVTIELRRIPIAQRRKAGKPMASEVAIAARLMVGVLPPEASTASPRRGRAVSGARRRFGHLLRLPRFLQPMQTHCRGLLPADRAVHRDPFLLFRLRGMEREKFVAKLDKGESSPARRKLGEVSESEPAPAIRDQGANAEVFWRGRPFPDDRRGQVALSGELTPRLGSFPFWRGQRDFLEAMSDLSSSAAERPHRPLDDFRGAH
jgi:uncharacterized Zn finger protein